MSPALAGGFFTIELPGKPSSEVGMVVSILLSLFYKFSEFILDFPDGTGAKKICLPMQEMWETQVRSLGQEDPLEEEMATHSSLLVWKIPQTKEPGGLQSMGPQRVQHNWVTEHT